MSEGLDALLARLHEASMALREASPTDPGYPDLLHAAQEAADAVAAALYPQHPRTREQPEDPPTEG